MAHLWSNEFVCGDGQRIVNVHVENNECRKFGCVIHNPTDPNTTEPTVWDESGLIGRIMRMRPDGTLRHDKDVLAFEARRATDFYNRNKR